MNLKTLHNYNLQEIFDFVVNHLLTQNEQSYLPDAITCAYRGQGGLKCAVGCLIADDEYDTKFETKGVDMIYTRTSNKTLRLLLGDLQYCHDVGLPSWWPSQLKKIADRFNLTWNH